MQNIHPYKFTVNVSRNVYINKQNIKAINITGNQKM